MEIKLSAGDKISIPTGCKATIKDDLIVIEEQKDEFKDGDILRSVQTGTIVIFKSYEDNLKDSFCSHYNSSNDSNFCFSPVAFRKTTEEEKQAFFDELRAKGLRWDAETKTMEKIRKRAETYADFLHISGLGDIVCDIDFGKGSSDDNYYKSGNYYLPSERAQAEEDAAKVRAIFQERLNKSK